MTMTATRRRQDDSGRGEGRRCRKRGEYRKGLNLSRIPRPRLHRQMRRIYVRCMYVRTYVAYNVTTTVQPRGRIRQACRGRVTCVRVRQREIRGHKPAYYASPRVTNTPNNGRGSVWRSGRYMCVCVYMRSGIVLNYNNSGANYQTDWEEEGKRKKSISRARLAGYALSTYRCSTILRPRCVAPGRSPTFVNKYFKP